MAQESFFQEENVSKSDPFRVSRNRLRNLGGEDQLLRLDASFDNWYQYDETSKPELPPDFCERLGIHLIVLLESHTINEAINKLSELLDRHISNPKMYVILFKTLRLFLHKAESLNYLSAIWSALLKKRKSVGGKTKIEEILKWFFKDSKRNTSRNFYKDPEDSSFAYSFIAMEIGDNFICLNESPTDLENMQTIYAMIINMVIEEIDIAKELNNKNSMLMRNNYEDSYSMNYYDRYLFHDIYQYIEYRSNELGQKQYISSGISHRTDGIKHLLKNLGSVLSQVIPLAMANKTSKRNASIREKLQNRSLTDEDILASTPIFRELLRTFYIERRYSFDYLSMEIVRNFCRLFSIVLGFLSVIYSFVYTEMLSLYAGVVILSVMVIFAVLVFPKKYFRAFYPKKLTNDLAKNINDYAYFFKRMNRDQLISFGENQIEDISNKDFFFLIPELIIYIYEQLSPQQKIKAFNENDIYFAANYLQQSCEKKARNL